jgi:hypothetical protein
LWERSTNWEICIRTQDFVAGMVALTTSCPSGFDLWWASCNSHFVLRVLPLSPFVLCLDLSFWERFDLFFLSDGLRRELIPFTEGFHLNPHEFIDRGESSSKVEELGFVAILCFSVDWFYLGQWSS